MATTGFKSISHVAEILDKPEIDEKGRHLILELLTKTLGENLQLKSIIDKKNQEMCHLHIDNRGYKDQVEMMEKEIERLNKCACDRRWAIEKQKETIDTLEDRLRTKGEEIEKHKHAFESLFQENESLEKQLKEKDVEIGQKTMELRQHSWRSNKMIYELQDKLDELQNELDETVKEREELRKEWKLSKGYT